MDRDVEYRDNVSLSCTTEGMPPPTVSWFVEHSGMPPKQLTSGTTSKKGVAAYEVISTLTLYDVEPSDTANYTCEAINALGAASDSAEVTVLGKLCCM